MHLLAFVPLLLLPLSASPLTIYLNRRSLLLATPPLFVPLFPAPVTAEPQPAATSGKAVASLTPKIKGLTGLLSDLQVCLQGHREHKGSASQCRAVSSGLRRYRPRARVEHRMTGEERARDCAPMGRRRALFSRADVHDRYTMHDCTHTLLQTLPSLTRDPFTQVPVFQSDFPTILLYIPKVRLAIPTIVSYIEKVTASAGSTDPQLAINLRSEIGRFFASLARLQSAARQEAPSETCQSYGLLLLHYDRFVKAARVYDRVTEVDLSQLYSGIKKEQLVYQNNMTVKLKDRVLVIGGPSMGKTGSVVGELSSNFIVRLDEERDEYREIKVIETEFIKRRLGEQEQDEVFTAKNSDEHKKIAPFV